MAAQIPQNNEPSFSDPLIQFCKAHPNQETRLTCTHCETPICPKCMIVCEVGMKCKQCTSKTFSHVVKAEKRDLIFGGGSAFALALLAGFIITQIFFGVGFFSILICFIVGRGAGDLTHRCARFKMSNTVKTVITTSAIIGMAIGLAPALLPTLVDLLETQPEAATFAYSYPLVQVACAIAFIFGMQNNFRFFR